MKKLAAIAIVIFWLVMVGLMIRKDVLKRREEAGLRGYQAVLTPDRSEYTQRMGIYISGRKLGASVTVFYYDNDGTYSISNTTDLTMPAIRPYLNEEVKASIYGTIFIGRSFQLTGFNFGFSSKHYDAIGRGRVSDDELKVWYRTPEGEREETIPVSRDETLSLGLLPFLSARYLEIGKKWTVRALNPLSLGQTTTTVEVTGREKIQWQGRTLDAFVLRFTHNGIGSTAWVADDGELIRAQTLFGITLEKEPLPEENGEGDPAEDIATAQ